MRCVAICLALALPGAIRAHAQCHIDPATGQRVCTRSPEANAGGRAPALDPRPSTLDHAAHCRITVADGSTGSGTLIAVDESLGLVLSCSHLFDQASGRVVVTFPDGSRFAARLIDRDRAHDLAALAIRRPAVAPLRVGKEAPGDSLTACGYGPHGQFRCVRGQVVGQAVAAGATEPSLTIAGAVRPGDSGGGVLNPRGEVVGVVWGQRDGLTYATCGRPLRNFVNRLRGQPYVAGDSSRNPAAPSPQSPVPNVPPDWQAWPIRFESQLRALDAKKQDKGDYVTADVLNGYVPIADLPELMPNGESGFLAGLSLAKLIAGALGLSGPLAAAVIVAGGLAGRRAKKHFRVDRKVESPGSRDALLRVPQPIAVDSPPPPQRTVPETHYVPIEKDSFAQAHQWASEHVARKYPGATEVLQAQDSLIKQYLAAK